MLEKGEEQFSEILALQQRRDFPRAVERLRKLQKEFAGTLWGETALQNLILLFEQDLRAPDQANAARRELLSLGLEPHTRLRLLERLRVDAVRRQESREIRELTALIQGIEGRLTVLRKADLRRYDGG
ncbi:MAG: hypothetical protein FJX77_13995 [Armatimonadetes bacterium]|nr:hypothetical protein [Armatimonadota bacterium]